MIDSKIKIHCTDNGRDLDTYILNYKPKAFLEVSLQTIKLRMIYKENTKAFVGSLGGKEFVIKEESLPQENKGYTR